MLHFPPKSHLSTFLAVMQFICIGARNVFTDLNSNSCQEVFDNSKVGV